MMQGSPLSIHCQNDLVVLVKHIRVRTKAIIVQCHKFLVIWLMLKIITYNPNNHEYINKIWSIVVHFLFDELRINIYCSP